MTRPIQVTVLGAGSWGTTVASLSAPNARTVLWARSQETADEINAEHRNSRYLARARAGPRPARDLVAAAKPSPTPTC